MKNFQYKAKRKDSDAIIIGKIKAEDVRCALFQLINKNFSVKELKKIHKRSFWRKIFGRRS